MLAVFSIQSERLPDENSTAGPAENQAQIRTNPSHVHDHHADQYC